MKEQFLTWALTLFATLGGIWLKDYLDTKKSKTLNKIQKAIKTYAILSKLPSSLGAKALICQELLKNKDFNYTPLLEKFPDETSELMEELEILIIENFYDLDNLFFEYQQTINARHLTLLGIITGSIKITSEDLQKLTTNYNTEIGKLSNLFKQTLKDQHMNKKLNFWIILNNLKLFIVDFFSKPK